MVDQDGHNVRLSTGKVKEIGRRYNERISKDAAIRVAMEAEHHIRRVWKLSAELADHSGRKTIMEEDVRLASDIIEREK